MYLLKNYSQTINRFISSQSARATLYAMVASLSFLLIVASVMLHYGAPVMNGRPWDVPALLDGGWRILNGQIPYRDFYAYHGPLAFYLAAAGMKLSHPSVSSILVGNVAFMTMLTIFSLVVFSRRTSALCTALFTTLIALLVIAPRPLGDPYDYIDHAMLYTRLGESTLLLLSALLFIPPHRQEQSWRDFLEMILAGCLITVLIFDKINYGVLGIAFLIVAIILRFFRFSMFTVCILSLGVSAALAFHFSGIPPIDMFRDFATASYRTEDAGRFKLVAIQGIKSSILLLPLFLLVWESALGLSKEAGRLEKIRRWAIPAMFFSAAVLLLSSNTQARETPLLAVAALFVVEPIRRHLQTRSHDWFSTARLVGSFCLMLVFVLPTVGTDFMTIRHTTWLAHKKQFVTGPGLSDTALADFRFDPEGTRWWYSREYMETLAEGVDLLRKHDRPDLRVAPFIFTDPFQIALKLRPNQGGTLFWDPTLFQYHNSMPPLKRLIGDTTVLLIPTGDHTLENAYGNEWSALNLKKIEQTKRFILYQTPDKL